MERLGWGNLLISQVLGLGASSIGLALVRFFESDIQCGQRREKYVARKIKYQQITLERFDGLDVWTFGRALHEKLKMPRACPVEFSRWLLNPFRSPAKLDATALSRGGSRSQLCSRDCETPRGKPVASGAFGFRFCLAANVRLHGASPWPPWTSPWDLSWEAARNKKMRRELSRRGNGD